MWANFFDYSQTYNVCADKSTPAAPVYYKPTANQDNATDGVITTANYDSQFPTYLLGFKARMVID